MATQTAAPAVSMEAIQAMIAQALAGAVPAPAPAAKGKSKSAPKAKAKSADIPDTDTDAGAISADADEITVVIPRPKTFRESKSGLSSVTKVEIWPGKKGDPGWFFTGTLGFRS